MVTREAVSEASTVATTPAVRSAASRSSTWGSSRTWQSTAHVEISMVLTIGWCPSVVTINQMPTEAVEQIEGVDAVDVEVVNDPVWTMEGLSSSARDKLQMDLSPLLPYRHPVCATTGVPANRADRHVSDRSDHPCETVACEGVSLVAHLNSTVCSTSWHQSAMDSPSEGKHHSVSEPRARSSSVGS